jgi:hypothetical protein
MTPTISVAIAGAGVLCLIAGCVLQFCTFRIERRAEDRVVEVRKSYDAMKAARDHWIQKYTDLATKIEADAAARRAFLSAAGRKGALVANAKRGGG